MPLNGANELPCLTIAPSRGGPGVAPPTSSIVVQVARRTGTRRCMQKFTTKMTLLLQHNVEDTLHPLMQVCLTRGPEPHHPRS